MRVLVAVVTLLSTVAGYAWPPTPFLQLYSGFNGPRLPHSFLFDSPVAVRDSWVALAVPNELEGILSKVDFARDVLIAVAVGERQNVNVPAKAVAADGLVIYLQSGVNMPDCAEPKGSSYPFVLVSVPKVKSQFASQGYDHQNYGNGCAKVMTGIPHDPGS